MARFWIGTSGYSIKEWRGPFYPADMPDEALLRYYSDRFPTVELNHTFHRMPNIRTVQGWAKETSPGFAFSLKAPRRITHDLRLRDAAEPLTYFCDTVRVLKDKLGALLFQIPPFVRKDVSRLEDFLHQLPPGYRPAFEFRNPAWLADDTFECLRRFDVALCCAEHPERAMPFEVTAPFGYFRLRRPDYSDAELEAWANRLLEAAPQWDDVFVYFKQDVPGRAPQLAERLLALVHPVAPVAAAQQS